MTKKDMLDVLKTLLRALDDAATPKPANPPPRPRQPPQSTGWVMDAFGCPIPADETVQFSQPTLVMDLVDAETFIKRAAPPTPQQRDIDITRAASRESTSHIDLADSRSWHP